jgi:uncharacterized membrane protein HdeD (DUF308 family)
MREQIRSESAPARDTTSSALSRAAGGLAVAAGLIHFYVAPMHFVEEGLAFGLFMLLVGAAQLAVGMAFLENPSPASIRGTILGTLVVLLLYLVSRTTGLPFGPHPGQPESVGAVDVVSKASESALLLVLLSLRRGWRRADECPPAASALAAPGPPSAVPARKRSRPRAPAGVPSPSGRG